MTVVSLCFLSVGHGLARLLSFFCLVGEGKDMNVLLFAKGCCNAGTVPGTGKERGMNVLFTEDCCNTVTVSLRRSEWGYV